MSRLLLVLFAICPTSLTFAQVSAETSPKQQRAENVVEITFDDLQFEIAQDAKFDRKMLGEKIEPLNDKRIKISGYILPSSVFQLKGIKKFILIHQDFELCKDPWPTIAQQVLVEMEGDASASFTTKPISVEGEFSVQELYVIDGRPTFIYRLKATSVTPLRTAPGKK